MGWDKHYGFQLYQSDPSGNYGGWKATCIGNNSAVCIIIYNLFIIKQYLHITIGPSLSHMRNVFQVSIIWK